MLKRCLSLAAIIIAMSISAHAQEIPEAEFAVTYSLLISDIDALDNEALHGYGFSVQGNINKYFAVVAEWTANHGSSGPITVAEPGTLNLIPEVDTRVQTFLAGPRFTYRHNRVTVFGHYLFGMGNQKVEDEESGFTTGNTSNVEFAMGVGGGLDIFLGKSCPLRTAQFDYLPIHTDINTRLTRPNDQGVGTIANNSSSWAHNVRFQTGIVYRWGVK